MTQSFVRTTERVQSGPLRDTRQFLRKARSVGRFLDTFHHQIAVGIKDVRSTSSGLSSSRSVITATINGCEIVLPKPIGIGLFR
jgi:hypothetical protein